jgi:antitoxin (DNA-binding transcriptional repressor) of toxin-antitoxin stability system
VTKKTEQVEIRSREFFYNVSAAKRLAEEGKVVIITNRDKPIMVLLGIQEYWSLIKTNKK